MSCSENWALSMRLESRALSTLFCFSGIFVAGKTGSATWSLLVTDFWTDISICWKFLLRINLLVYCWSISLLHCLSSEFNSSCLWFYLFICFSVLILCKESPSSEWLINFDCVKLGKNCDAVLLLSVELNPLESLYPPPAPLDVPNSVLIKLLYFYAYLV